MSFFEMWQHANWALTTSNIQLAVAKKLYIHQCKVHLADTWMDPLLTSILTSFFVT